MVADRFRLGDPGHVDEHNLIANSRFNVRDPQFAGGAVGDGTTDDYPAFRAALDALEDESGNISNGGTIYVPGAATYRLAQTLELKRGMRLVGDSMIGTQLAFDDGVSGIIVHHLWSIGDQSGNAQWTEISDIRIKGKAKTIAGANGVQLLARARLRNVFIENFSGIGLHVFADGSNNANANNWYADYLRIQGCGSHGVYTDGGDANAGTAINVDASSNGGWGIYDSSFLGCHWFGCHTANNTLGAYKSDGVASSGTFLGCYSEGGQPASDISYPAIVIGGAHGAGFASTTTALVMQGATHGARLRGTTPDRKLLYGTQDGVGDLWQLRVNGFVMPSPDGTLYRLQPPADGGGAAVWANL